MYNLDEQDRRIAAILGTEDITEVDDETLELYRDYLNTNLELPCQLTGIEDFPWEERYVLGPGSKAEYERLKKTHPSYTDKHELIHINEIDEDAGVLAAVRRVSDKKGFTLPLADLKTTDKKSKDYQLLDDYSVWYVNNR